MGNHDRLVFLNVIKTCLLFTSIYYGLENIDFQIFYANQRIKGQFLRRLKNSQCVLYWIKNTWLSPCVLNPIKHSCSFFKYYLKIVYYNRLKTVFDYDNICSYELACHKCRRINSVCGCSFSLGYPFYFIISLYLCYFVGCTSKGARWCNTCLQANSFK